MYSNYSRPNFYQNPNYSTNYRQNNDDRFIGGGFLGPFVLGGITGGLLAPAFYPRPYYNNNFYGPCPYCYGPYYR